MAYAEDLDRVLQDPNCTGIIPLRDLYLGSWLSQTTPVRIVGTKTIYGDVEGRKVVVDMGFEAAIGPIEGNYTAARIRIDRISSTAAEPKAQLNFER